MTVCGTALTAPTRTTAPVLTLPLLITKAYDVFFYIHFKSGNDQYFDIEYHLVYKDEV